jgi:adenylate kinase
LFRKEYEKKSREGLEAYNYWSKGQWVPDEVTFALLKIYLDRTSNGFILDGFPRTKIQCEILDRYVQEKGQIIDKAIYLKVSEEQALKRLILRGETDKNTTGKKRDDEEEQIIRARFKSFFDSVDPILTYYRESKKLLEINGERAVDEIHGEILTNLKFYKK